MRNTVEIKTRTFFSRPADIVVSELAANIYGKDEGKVTFVSGQAKIIKVETPEGVKNYRIAVAESYLEQEASPIWKGKRAEQIRGLAAGETITYRSRSGELTFIKTTGADNILIRGLKEVETGQDIINASEVTRTLGLNPGATGRLTLVDNDHLRFVRTS
ncbi:hypothetical protein A3I48_00250 [Candidatus Daviesbacteria bacterium RIFCSPLOWO2_02_FULL_36_7]|uniref:Uncharacterized protein n=1 Tax=Candidatus Daviesbacteria bacterium RIFCSPLOWO2_02_FULL_36_7 TaxID=1797792 RepID=A0A1F5MGX5_9BACT|nr:MAG: hypothetical protein A3I48_00250 [Candidatus Daviesbacteria bacterium RIFCSPLOWO2_02_FULL_36_7]